VAGCGGLVFKVFLSVFEFVVVAGAVAGVDEDGGGGEGGGGPPEEKEEIAVGGQAGGEVGSQEGGDDHGELGGGAEFADGDGDDFEFRGEKVEDEKAQGNVEVLADDDGNDGAGQAGAGDGGGIDGQQEGGTGDEEFVGQGVEEGAEHGDAAVFAGQIPVQPVAHRHDQKDQQGQVAGPGLVFGAVDLEHGHDEGQDEQDAGDGDAVGPGHAKFGHTITALFRRQKNTMSFDFFYNDFF